MGASVDEGDLVTEAVLVTGASTGIGEATAARLVAGGRRVFAGVRSETDAERLRAELGERCEPVRLDVTDPEEIANAAATVAEALEAGDRLVGLVNNAGVAVGGPLEYLAEERWRWQLEVNVFGQIAVTKAFLELLREGRGRVVFIGSISGRFASPLMGPYAASKYAIEGIAEALRGELHPAGIEVVLVEPGAVATPIWDKGRSLLAEITDELPPIALTRYAPFVEGLRDGIEFQASTGVAPEVVAEVVDRALTVRRPRPRYLVGPDAKFLALLVRFTPDGLRDRIMRLVMGKLG